MRKNILTESFITTHIFTISNTFYFFLHFHVTSDVISFHSAWYPLLTFWGRFASNEFSLFIWECLDSFAFAGYRILAWPFFIFFHFDILSMSFYCLWVSIVSEKNQSSINPIDVSLYVISHFSLAGLKFFSLSFSISMALFKYFLEFHFLAKNSLWIF